MKFALLKAKWIVYKSSFRNPKKLFFFKRKCVGLTCMVLLMFISINALQKDIIINDDGNEIAVRTWGTTVEKILDKNKIVLEHGDVLNCDIKDKVVDNKEIKISRAKNINLIVAGEVIKIKMAGDSVGEIIAKSDIDIDYNDKVQPSKAQAVINDMSIKIVKVDEKIETKTVKIPHTTQRKTSSKIDKGLERVIAKGVDGEASVMSRITYEDGVVVRTEEINETVIKEPKVAIVETGTIDTVAMSRGEITRFKSVHTMYATAYDLCKKCCGKSPDHKGYGITASGLRAKVGVIAVDTKIIPLGTWVYVPGIGELVAADTGSGIKGNRIDVFCNDHNFKPRDVKVYVLDKPKFNFKKDKL